MISNVLRFRALEKAAELGNPKAQRNITFKRGVNQKKKIIEKF